MVVVVALLLLIIVASWLVQVVYRGSTIADAAIIHNDSTGQLLMQSKPPTPIPGLYGWGIAFPELWTGKRLRWLSRVTFSDPFVPKGEQLTYTLSSRV